MEETDFNNILDRNIIAEKIKTILNNFQKNKGTINKRGIYIYGSSGIGKTMFIKKILDELDYDIINYNAGNIRNKLIIESIASSQTSNSNVVNLFHRKYKPIAIIMDEIDGMNGGDKGGINALIKLIRPKKTKKQKQEKTCNNPIICISNYHADKKIKELMKVCECFEIKSPTNQQMKQIAKKYNYNNDTDLIDKIVYNANNDIRKLISIMDLVSNNKINFNKYFISNNFDDDTKNIVSKLYKTNETINNHNLIINDNDRTIVSLLWHENVIDMFKNLDIKKTLPIYENIINNICFGDYIDRITFQKQIWQLNEISSLLKTFQTNNYYHLNYNNVNKINEIRFTKVLTKYSTEYNNSIFINDLCEKTQMDKEDLLQYFIKIRNNNNPLILETLEITNLDIDRLYRYIDNCYFNEII
tara:strand:+ start:2985 stop:4232 length:1248 start_codon:yes stop_codon:yes gene_type:complete